MGFNWGKMEGTPESRIIREQGRLSLEALAERSDRMAANITASPAFLKDVDAHVQEILDGTEKEKEALANEIALRHPDAIPEIVEDPRDIAALIIQVAKRIDRMRGTKH